MGSWLSACCVCSPAICLSPHLSVVLRALCREEELRAGREMFPGASHGSGEETCACPVRGEGKRVSGKRRNGEVGKGRLCCQAGREIEAL